MSDVRPLPIYVAPGVTLDMESVKAAKAALDLPFRVKPITAEFEGTARILAVGGRPGDELHGEKRTWLCDYAMVSERTTPAGWKAALSWVLSDEDHPKATTILDQLKAILGPGVREISPEELASEEALAIYLAQ